MKPTLTFLTTLLLGPLAALGGSFELVLCGKGLREPFNDDSE